MSIATYLVNKNQTEKNQLCNYACNVYVSLIINRLYQQITVAW